MTLGRRALAALAAAAVVALASACGSGVRKTAGNGYTFTLPSSWHQVSPPPAGVVAAYERSDHTALLHIRTEPGRLVISRRFIRSLGAQLQRRLKGYRPLSHQIIVTKAGPAFLFAYTQQGERLTSILLVPAKGQSYVLDAVSNPASKPAAHDIATIFNSFVPQG